MILLKKNESGVASPEKILANEDVFLKDKNFSHTEDTLPWDVGTRELTNDELNHLVVVTKPIHESILYYKTIGKAFERIAEILRLEDISFNSALQFFIKVGINPKILIKVYTSQFPEENIHTLYEILVLGLDGPALNKKDAQKIERDLYKTIKKDPFERMVVSETGTHTYTINNHLKKVIEHKKEDIRNEKDFSTTQTIINAYLKELTVYDNQLDEDTRLFLATFESKISKRPLRIGPLPVDDITLILSESGYVESSKLAKDALPRIFNAFIASGKAIEKNEIDYPGFFYDRDKKQVLAVKYEINDIEIEELKNALILLEDLARWFENQKEKFSHILKWGLISPFIFAIKQKGRWIEWLYLYGKAGSGKTTMANVVLYLWGKPDNNTNEIGGSSFNTQARMGDRLKQFTFPIVVNEPGSVFQNKEVLEMLKSAIERIYSRGKFEGRSYRNILSLAPVIFTSNNVIPDDDSILRRFNVITFTHSERKTQEEKDAFAERFKMDNEQDCRLYELKPLAQFVANEMITDPGLLEKNYKELADMLIFRMYNAVSLEVPEWIKTWTKTETLEDLDALHIERIRIALQNEINDAYGRIDIYDEDGRIKNKKYDNTVEVKTTEDFAERIWVVSNNRKIPWMFLNKKDEIILTTGFNEFLRDNIQLNETLQSISELLGWKYSNSRVRTENYAGRLIKVKRKDFTSFLFPDIEDSKNSKDIM